MSDSDSLAFGFDCPNCGDTTAITDVDDPEDVAGNIYECEGCGENVLMRDYVEDSP